MNSLLCMIHERYNKSWLAESFYLKNIHYSQTHLFVVQIYIRRVKLSDQIIIRSIRIHSFIHHNRLAAYALQGLSCLRRSLDRKHKGNFHRSAVIGWDQTQNIICSSLVRTETKTDSQMTSARIAPIPVLARNANTEIPERKSNVYYYEDFVVNWTILTQQALASFRIALLCCVV